MSIYIRAALAILLVLTSSGALAQQAGPRGYFSGPTGHSGGGGAVVDDTNPQLGGNLDTNGFDIIIDDNHGIVDDSLNEYLWFQKTATAVNYFEITNSATLNNPLFAATGSDTNVGLNFQAKGSGVYNFLSNATQQSELRLYEDTDNGANFLALRTATSFSSDATLTIPAITDTIVTRTASETLTNKTLTAPVIGTISNSGTITIPTGTHTLVGRTTTDTLTNKTLTSPVLTTPSAFTTGGTITLAEQHSIALDPAGSADGAYSGTTVTGTSGYSQAFGDVVYKDPTDSRWEAVDANAASGADGDGRGLIGMVVSAGTDGNACTILLQGIIRADAKFAALTINGPVYASETAGDITQTAPTTTDAVIRSLGAALTADEMFFNPSADWITHE